MDIQELKQFESVYQPSKKIAYCWGVKKYVQLCLEEDHTDIVGHANDSLRIWQAAKAQAVPETQQALNDRLLVKSIREHVESHIAEVSVNDLFDKGWLAAMKCIQNNIDMLEVQEPTKTKAVPECTWSQNEDGYFDASCGQSFVFSEPEDKPSKHKFTHCCFCGGKLVEAQEPAND